MPLPDSIPWVATGKTLGAGGQAEVYLVTRRDQSDSRHYALKVLKRSDSKQARDRFSQEIHAVKSLDFPLVAKIVDHSKPDDLFQYYTMEYYEGARTLANVVFSGLNPFHGHPIECLDLFESVLSCIQKCEMALPQIIHRDITPKNILLLTDRSIRLIDFGICLIQDGQRVTLIDEDVGTRNYTAPECEAGGEQNIGIHSDLYSAGKVLWSIITSQRAFAREKPVFSNRSLEVTLPDVPDAWHLNAIFEKTIRANPVDRAKNAQELIDLTREVRYLIRHGFPPLQEIAKRCPSCGHAQIADYPSGFAVFGNPKPREVEYYMCNYCGFGFLRDVGHLTQRLQSFLNSE